MIPTRWTLIVLSIVSLTTLTLRAEVVEGDEIEPALQQALELLLDEDPLNEQGIRAAVQQQLKIALPPRPGVAPTPDPKPTTAATTPETPATPKAPVDPHIVRLSMADGTIVTGKLTITDLVVDTKFGRLSVPITKLRYAKPGLESRPKQREAVALWIQKLGAEAPTDRKAAAAELLKLGPSIRAEVEKATRDEDAQRANEAKNLLQQLTEMIDGDFHSAAELTTLDVIATSEFTLTGKIVPQSVQLETDIGKFTMQVADLLKIDRDTGEPSEESKSLTVNEENFVNRTFKSTGIRVNKGDKIIVRATGGITMARWGNVVSTPDGAANTGWYQSGKIYNGALVLRIGSSGTIHKAGSAVTLTATEAGVIHFGIAMNPRFGADGYQYPGEFKVDVKAQKK